MSRSRYLGYAIGPAGRYNHTRYEHLDPRGYPSHENPPFSLSVHDQPAESILVEATINEIESSKYKLYVFGNAHEAVHNNAAGLHHRNWLRFVHPALNKAVAEEAESYRPDEYHALVSHLPIPQVPADDKGHIWLRVSTGGTEEQYLKAPPNKGYARLQSYPGTFICTPIGHNIFHCYAFRFEFVDSPAEELVREHRIPRVSLSKNGLPPNEWMDAVQIQVVQTSQPVTLTVNFRIITDPEACGFCHAHLFDILSVESSGDQ